MNHSIKALESLLVSAREKYEEITYAMTNLSGKGAAEAQKETEKIADMMVDYEAAINALKEINIE